MCGSLFVVQLNKIVTNRLMQKNKVERITKYRARAAAKETTTDADL